MAEKTNLPEQSLKGLTPLQASIVKKYGLNLANPDDWKNFVNMESKAREMNLQSVEDLEGGNQSLMVKLANEGTGKLPASVNVVPETDRRK